MIDASGKYVIPGAIDPHTHIEMFFGGTTTCDDFTSGTAAAAFGGTTSLVDFCMQAPGTPFPQALENYFEKIERCKPVIDVGFHIGVTDLAGRRRARGAGQAARRGDHLLQALHGLQGRRHGRRRDALQDDAGRERDRRRS